MSALKKKKEDIKTQLREFHKQINTLKSAVSTLYNLWDMN